jgi:hypothetical protein
MEYPWYDTISYSEQVLQGDLILNCPFIIPPATFEDELAIEVKTANAIVMSQSCDIENGKIDIILVCPYYNLEFVLANHPTSQDGSKRGINKVKENLTQGNYPHYHILEKAPELDFNDFIVVDFKNVYGVQYKFLKNHLLGINRRARLLPPYREHLSQAFARYFMRVGLPLNIEF